jgi:hypothetical protein
MKKLIFAIVLALELSSCSNSNNERNNVSIQSAEVPGFNLQNFAALAKTTSDASKIETAINASGNTVNNLDLNKDGNTDFLKVDETDKTITVTDNDVNPAVTVCTMTVTPNGNNQANVNIQGSPQYCGSDYNYHSSFTLTDYLLLSYMLRPHVYYHPYYSYGYHPAYYQPYRTSSYRTVRTTTYTRPSSFSSSNSSFSSRRSVSSPSSSQRSFSTTTNDGSSRSSTFGSSSSRSSRSSSFGSSRSSRSSFGSSRSSSFGGGRSGRR